MYRKIRFFTRFMLAVSKKYRRTIVFVFLGTIILGVLVQVALSRHIFTFFNYHQTIGVVASPTVDTIPEDILKKISIGLTVLDETGLPQPGLASSWEVLDEGKTYRFHINTSFVWQDGSRVKSSDLNYNFTDAKILRPDDSTLVIELKDKFAPLLTSVVSKSIFKTNSSTFIGVGLYRVGKVKKNGNYIEFLSLLPKSGNSLPVLDYYFYPSSSAVRTAFKLGIVDTIEESVSDDIIKSWPNISIKTSRRLDRYVGIFFNTESEHLSGSDGKNLRLSLAYALDKSHFLPRAVGPINSSSWAYNPEIKLYDQDIPHAKQLIKKIEKLPKELTIVTQDKYLPIAERVKRDWEAVGISTKIEIRSDIPQDYQVAISVEGISADPDQYQFWHSTQNTNLTQLKNPRIDKLLEDGRKTTNFTERKKIYQDFQKFLVEEMPVIFLYYPQQVAISRI